MAIDNGTPATAAPASRREPRPELQHPPPARPADQVCPTCKGRFCLGAIGGLCWRKDPTRNPLIGELQGVAWKQTASGKAFRLLAPRAQDVLLEDIAHALATTNRYGGHAPEPYSVAQHSVLVSTRSYVLAIDAGKLPEEAVQVARWGLLHDAAEAYVGDMTSPMKDAVPGFRELERRVQAVICEAFDLPEKQPDLVHRADKELMATEAAVFFPEGERPAPWPHLPYPPLAGVDVRPWDWRIAKKLFLARFRELWVTR